ncbi:hypothetical protein C8Q77DRAFT_110313 [Trametes polyzona]|nr:hypothetical protein C8Q77DRAFT_110313 [Trametes polyzona]
MGLMPKQCNNQPRVCRQDGYSIRPPRAVGPASHKMLSKLHLRNIRSRQPRVRPRPRHWPRPPANARRRTGAQAYVVWWRSNRRPRSRAARSYVRAFFSLASSANLVLESRLPGPHFLWRLPRCAAARRPRGQPANLSLSSMACSGENDSEPPLAATFLALGPLQCKSRRHPRTSSTPKARGSSPAFGWLTVSCPRPAHRRNAGG